MSDIEEETRRIRADTIRIQRQTDALLKVTVLVWIIALIIAVGGLWICGDYGLFSTPLHC